MRDAGVSRREDESGVSMWRERYKKTGAPVAAGLLAIALIAGCSPDGPGAGVPTHPSDTWSVTLEWDAPTIDAVGRPLEDLSGYRLYYRETGSAPGSEAMVELDSGTRATVEGLPAGDYLFAVTALDNLGNESDLSNPLPVEVGP
ncbi:MAG: fibronectin type III domain-containing protein [Gemmatimonadetes bacterium]|nr:fibronectin type III domain-containing protein [Gemmatimonadota bacterium]